MANVFRGADSYRFLNDNLNFMSNDKVDIIIIHAPNETSVGEFVAEEVCELWTNTLKERRKNQKECYEFPILCPDWKTISEELVCTKCKKDILPENLNCVILDGSYLLLEDLLEMFPLFCMLKIMP